MKLELELNKKRLLSKSAHVQIVHQTDKKKSRPIFSFFIISKFRVFHFFFLFFLSFFFFFLLLIRTVINLTTRISVFYCLRVTFLIRGHRPGKRSNQRLNNETELELQIETDKLITFTKYVGSRQFDTSMTKQSKVQRKYQSSEARSRILNEFDKFQKTNLPFCNWNLELNLRTLIAYLLILRRRWNMSLKKSLTNGIFFIYFSKGIRVNFFLPQKYLC